MVTLQQFPVLWIPCPDGWRDLIYMIRVTLNWYHWFFSLSWVQGLSVSCKIGWNTEIALAQYHFWINAGLTLLCPFQVPWYQWNRYFSFCIMHLMLYMYIIYCKRFCTTPTPTTTLQPNGSNINFIFKSICFNKILLPFRIMSSTFVL